MDKLMRVIACVCIAAFGLGLDRTAQAKIEVTISDGAKLVTSTTTPPLAGFTLSKSSPAGSDDYMPLLKCATRPCKVYFPSGLDVAKNDDTYVFRDLCAPGSCTEATAARIIKTDLYGGSIHLTGLQVASLSNGAKSLLTITFSTAAGDMTGVPAWGTFPASAFF